MQNTINKIKEILKDICEVKNIEFAYCSNVTLPDASNALTLDELEKRGEKYYLKDGEFLTFAEAAIIELVYKNKTHKIWTYVNPDESTLEYDLLSRFRIDVQDKRREYFENIEELKAAIFSRLKKDENEITSK